MAKTPREPLKEVVSSRETLDEVFLELLEASREHSKTCPVASVYHPSAAWIRFVEAIKRAEKFISLAEVSPDEEESIPAAVPIREEEDPDVGEGT